MDFDLDDPDPTFSWERTREVLEACPGFRCDPGRRGFRGRSPGGQELLVRPPLIQPIGPSAATTEDYLATLPEVPGAQLVLLLQAGATALGWFEATDCIRTKAIKKYVVRGHGKAQPTHLESKGKSRYGSRLRLQNARALLTEINERVAGYYREFGPPDQVFYNCPVRLWSDLCAASPAPPFDPEEALRIPLDVPVPTTEVLLRTYRKMSFGQVESG